MPATVAFLFDVDNTLLDNDRVKADFAAGIERLVGKALGNRFWELYEHVRAEREYVDIPATLERLREDVSNPAAYAAVAELVLSYPFEAALYPGALEVVAHVQEIGPAAIVTDGDPVYQPAKIERAGLARAVGGRVFVYDNKAHHLRKVQAAVPADRYVLVDDKRSILADVEDLHADVVTIHVRQGHYADQLADDPAPNLTIDRIGDLLAFDPASI